MSSTSSESVAALRPRSPVRISFDLNAEGVRVTRHSLFVQVERAYREWNYYPLAVEPILNSLDEFMFE